MVRVSPCEAKKTVGSCDEELSVVVAEGDGLLERWPLRLLSIIDAGVAATVPLLAKVLLWEGYRNEPDD